METPVKVIEEYLTTQGVLIGSRRWGGYKQDSDYDYVISSTQRDAILKIADGKFHIPPPLPGMSIGGHTMFNLVNEKVWIGEKLYNIITYANNDIPKIIELNRIMDFMINNTPMGDAMAKDKGERILVVEGILCTLFMVPQEDIDELGEISF